MPAPHIPAPKPPSGSVYSVRLDAATVRAVDGYARARRISRSSAIRVLLDVALRREAR